jgi:hypothetical protein
MPSGIIHESLRQKGRIIFYPLSIIIPLAVSYLPIRDYGELIIGIGMVFGYEMGRYITPDADIMGTTSSEGFMVNEIPILGHFIFGVLSSYGSIFRKYHRSFWTHFPFVSTAIRYLFLFWWIFYQIYQSKMDLYWAIFLFMGMFVGTSLSDAIHWGADISGFWKGE